MMYIFVGIVKEGPVCFVQGKMVQFREYRVLRTGKELRGSKNGSSQGVLCSPNNDHTTCHCEAGNRLKQSVTC